MVITFALRGIVHDDECLVWLHSLLPSYNTGPPSHFMYPSTRKLSSSILFENPYLLKSFKANQHITLVDTIVNAC